MSGWLVVVLSYYGLQLLAVILLILLGVLIYDKRFKSKQGESVPEGFQRTNEINIDPVTQEKTRVYYNPETGERFYKSENS